MGWPYAIEASSYAGDQHRPDHSPLRMQCSPSSPGSGRAFFERFRMPTHRRQPKALPPLGQGLSLKGPNHDPQEEDRG